MIHRLLLVKAIFLLLVLLKTRRRFMSLAICH